MKTTFIFALVLITAFFSQNCIASTYGDGDGNTKETSTKSAKTIEKERYITLKQDQKYLKAAKKQYWEAQSKQVKKTIKQTEKRNRMNSTEQTVLY